jgi:hypothetical protein
MRIQASQARAPSLQELVHRSRQPLSHTALEHLPTSEIRRTSD